MCDESEERGRFWLTGSQRKKNIERSRESLAGRLGILHLYGLSQREKSGVLHPAPLDFSMESLMKRKALLPDNDIIGQKLGTVKRQRNKFSGIFPYQWYGSA